MHHAIIDGESGTELLKALHSLTPAAVKDDDGPVGGFTADREASPTGRHVLKVVAQPTVGDLTRREAFETTFLVVEGTEGNTLTLNGPPSVLRFVPRSGAGGVPVSVLPEVVFSEPVVNVPAGVFLEEVRRSGTDVQVLDAIPLSLVGTKPDGQVVPVVGPSDVVVSVTAEPQRGLKHSAEYRLRVSGPIQDQDATPETLDPEEQAFFTTFGPEDLETETERYSSAGLALLGDLPITRFGSETVRQYGRTMDSHLLK